MVRAAWDGSKGQKKKGYRADNSRLDKKYVGELCNSKIKKAEKEKI